MSKFKRILPKPVEEDKLHKQPLGYLKTVGKYVGKATDETTLFSLPEIKQDSGGSLPREIISRHTAILGNYLFQLFQQRGGEELVINNLSELSEFMGTNNHEVKIYLLYLGGYVYPITERDERSGELTLTVAVSYTHLTLPTNREV